MKIKYKTTVYNNKHPYGIERIRITEGEQVEQPSYLLGCNGCIFLKNSKNQIFVIEPEKIIKMY